MTSDILLPANPRRIALLLVDIQGFTVDAELAPHSGQTVLENASLLADACRERGIAVVLIQASGGPGGVLALHPPADRAMPALNISPSSHEIHARLGRYPGDVVITKFNWGAFYGTDLSVQLRRRGIDSLIVAGIASNFGVEATVRQAHERGYSLIVVSDACSAFEEREHLHPFESIFPRIARVRTTEQLLGALDALPVQR